MTIEKEATERLESNGPNY